MDHRRCGGDRRWAPVRQPLARAVATTTPPSRRLGGLVHRPVGPRVRRHHGSVPGRGPAALPGDRAQPGRGRRSPDRKQPSAGGLLEFLPRRAAAGLRPARSGWRDLLDSRAGPASATDARLCGRGVPRGCGDDAPDHVARGARAVRPRPAVRRAGGLADELRARHVVRAGCAACVDDLPGGAGAARRGLGRTLGGRASLPRISRPGLALGAAGGGARAVALAAHQVRSATRVPDAGAHRAALAPPSSESRPW